MFPSCQYITGTGALADRNSALGELRSPGGEWLGEAEFSEDFV